MRIEQNFLADFKNIMQAARNRAYAAINYSMVHDYWNVGHELFGEKHSFVRKAEFGTILIRDLLEDLPVFLLHSDKGFCYVKTQVRIYTDIKSSYIDLVFYSHRLKCFVLVSLTTGVLMGKDRRQLDGYLRLFDHQYRSQTDNPTIGVILCTNKDETTATYWLTDNNLRYYLPKEEELIARIERKKRVIEQQLKTTDFQ